MNGTSTETKKKEEKIRRGNRWGGGRVGFWVVGREANTKKQKTKNNRSKENMCAECMSMCMCARQVSILIWGKCHQTRYSYVKYNISLFRRYSFFWFFSLSLSFSLCFSDFMSENGSPRTWIDGAEAQLTKIDNDMDTYVQSFLFFIFGSCD